MTWGVYATQMCGAGFQVCQHIMCIIEQGLISESVCVKVKQS